MSNLVHVCCCGWLSVRTEMLPVERVAVNWGRGDCLGPLYRLASLYKNAVACPSPTLTHRPKSCKHKRSSTSLATFILNLPNFPSTHWGDITKHSHPALPPALWQVYTADLYGTSIRPIQALTTCRTATAHAQALLGGGAWRQGWGLVWLILQRNSSRSYYFAMFSEVTWHLGHVIDLKHSL